MSIRKQEVLQWIAGRSASGLFWLSTLYLVAVAFLVVLWVDVPSLQKATQAITGSSTAPAFHSEFRGAMESVVVSVILLIWPIVIIEAIFHWFTRPWDKSTRRYHWLGLLFCFLPALRMCARSYEMGDRLWLPGLGWRKGDKRLRRRLERQFSVPMIVIALMIMPILVVEFFMKAQVANYAWLRFLLHTGTGVIWFAFAFEFVLMVSIAKSKLAYCKKHWVDLAIILLPFVSFLRSLRLLRATSLANFLRLPQLTKVARVYRLRGTAIKVIQSLILLDIFQRFSRRNPDRAIDKLTMRLEDLEHEAKLVRREISKLQRQKAECESEVVSDATDESVSDAEQQQTQLPKPTVQASHLAREQQKLGG